MRSGVGFEAGGWGHLGWILDFGRCVCVGVIGAKRVVGVLLHFLHFGSHGLDGWWGVSLGVGQDVGVVHLGVLVSWELRLWEAG